MANEQLFRAMSSPLYRAAQTVTHLEARFEELGGSPPDDWRGVDLRDLSLRVTLLEARTRIECDEIIRRIATLPTGAPTPTSLQAYFLACRCRCALDTLAILTRPKNDAANSRIVADIPNDWTETDLLLWLMVETWGERHDAWLKLTAAAVAAGNPYYSG